MRTIILFFFMISTFSVHATEILLKPLSPDPNAQNLVLLGPFSSEKKALQLKTKLASELFTPMDLSAQNPQGFFIKIGPLADQSQALALKAKLQTFAELKPSTAPPESVTEIPPAINPHKKLAHEKLNEPEELEDKKLWNLTAADIRAVIMEVSRITGKNFIVDPRVQGKISIISSTPMSSKELYQVFLSMLQVSGYAAIPNGKVIKIVPNVEAKTMAPDQLNQLQHPPQGDAMMVEVIPVRYVSADQLLPVIRSLMPPWSNVSVYAPSNMLILSGRANNIKQVSSIIKQVDSSSANDIDIVPLKHMLAMEVANILKDLIKNEGHHQNAAILSADDRNNAILIAGSKTERIKLRLLIAKLDNKDRHDSNSNTQVVYLNYLRAEDLAPILAGIAQANFSGTVGVTIGTITTPILDSTNPISSIVSEGQSSPDTSIPAAATPKFTNPAATANTSSANPQHEGSSKPTVQIIAEPNTNSIIINAPLSIIRILKKVITQLDIRPAQLLIEALVAEVDQSDLTSLGIEWGSAQTQYQGQKVFRPGFAIINSKTALSDFQAQIYALVQERKANILSTPSVVVLDNRQAKILVGKQVSVAATTYPNNASGTTTASPYVTYNRVNVALHLYVRPQITRGKGIQLQIDQGNDTLDPNSANTTNPIFKISSIVTSIHVESGDIVVLGGLTQDSLGLDNNQVPFLSRLPCIGGLFQRNHSSREKRVLMVFIKPSILNTEQEAIAFSNSKYFDLRRYQLKWVRQQPRRVKYKGVILPSRPQVKLPRPFCSTAANEK